MAPSHDSALSPGALVLVTGVNGFIGGHVACEILSRGFRVRGTVRDEKKASWARSFYGSRFPDRFEAVVLEDMSSPAAFSDLLTDVSGIAHVASPTTFSTDPAEVVDVAVAGVLNLLRAATKAPSVTRFVLTSSATAACFPSSTAPQTVTPETWNTAALDAIADPSHPAAAAVPRPYLVYGASKAKAEMEAFKFVESEKPRFVFNAVLPDTTFGRVLDWEKQNPSTAGGIRGLVEGSDSPFDFMKFVPPQYYVDVQDVARIHAAALTNPTVSNERLFAFAHKFTWRQILGILGKLRPGYELPPAPSAEEDAEDKTVVSNARAEGLLEGGKWVSLEESLRGNVEGIPERT